MSWARTDPRLGVFSIEPLDLERDLTLLHAWVTHPRSVFWQLGGAGTETVREAYAAIEADPHHHAWLGRRDGEPAFLVETYDPAHSELSGHPALQPHDLGMHVLVAPPEHPQSPKVPGLTGAVMRAVMAFCFDDPQVVRVVVEPDVRNEGIARLNAAAGFTVHGQIELPAKTAALSFCTRAEHERRCLAALVEASADPVPHLSPEPMAIAQRALVTKALSEFSHERLLNPRPDGADGPDGPDGAGWVLETAGSRYRFAARAMPLAHWAINPDSLVREIDGVPALLDAQDLVLELTDVLGIPESLLGVYLEEIAATLAALAWTAAHPAGRDVATLLTADLLAVEAAMTRGHPGFVASHGRIGFGTTDHAAYAPETGAGFQLVWLAAHREHSHLSLAHDLDEPAFYAEQVGPDLLAGFAARLRELGLDPGDYRYLPVHPWQWEHRIAVTFAPDVAARRLVPVGTDPGDWRPQQSIRTMLDAAAPHRHYVKTALAIQNMGFLRGLSPAYMRPTPAINDWVAGVVAADDELRGLGLGILREVAAIGYTGDAHHRALTRGGRGVGSGSTPAYRKMIAALWRESAVPRLAPGERAATMAALLHQAPDGAHLVTGWIEASGLDVAAWVRRYLEAYLRPVVHCLLAHDLATMPHGENVILVLRDHVPVRALFKDIGEEVVVVRERELPAQVGRISTPLPPQIAALSVFTDVFDGVLRHLGAILDLDGVLPVADFWAQVGSVVAAHAKDHPDLHGWIDLFAPTFAHSCLNRLQLRNAVQMVDLTDQAASLIYAGTLENPIAGARP